MTYVSKTLMLPKHLHMIRPLGSARFYLVDLIFLWLQGQILKQNRNDDMRARMVLPSVNDPNVLVLQGVKKAARGNYSCRVGNSIPTHDFEVQSDPIFLDVKCKYILLECIILRV